MSGNSVVSGALLGLAVLAVPAAALDPPRDPLFVGKGAWKQAHDDQWAIKRVGFTSGADSAWALVTPQAKPVVVAVVDTGLDWNHLDVGWDQVWRNEKEVPDNRVDDDGNGYVDDVIGWDFFAGGNKPWDHDGHGTFVAGVIAARWNGAGIAGINPLARIMVVKAINNFGHSRASYLAEGIKYAADNGARVINLSVGGPNLTRVERAAVDYAHAKGALVVVAAGNEAVDVAGFGLAGAPSVVTVASTDLDDRRAAFSNWGGAVDLSAPGLDVLSLRARRTDTMLGIPGVEYEKGSAYVGRDNRYYRAGGTSFSAPIVSGVASLVWSMRPELTNDDVRRILLHSARDVDSPGRDQYTGYGLVDARAALAADPGFFVEAEIVEAKVVQAAGATVVEVMGTADADRFRGARVDLGAGKAPPSWRAVGTALSRPVRGGVLAAIPAQAFAGAKEWTVRLVVEHENGSRREMRFLITLG